jgi:tetratricopeptide (TPR) repeat protein
MLRDQPRSYRTQWLYAVKLWRAGRIDLAEAHFEFAYRLYARDSKLLTEYAQLMMAQRRFAEAVPLLESVEQMNPGTPRNSVTLMHAYMAVGRYRDAIETAATALRTGAPPLATMPLRAFSHQQLGNVNEAIAGWMLAVHYSPTTSWQLHGHLARALAAGGLTDRALARLDSARAALPDSAAHAVMTSVERAVRAGCYRATAAAAREDGSFPLPPERPLGFECDDLGHWFDYLVAGQNANVSQNASSSTSPAPVITPPDTL